MFVCGWQIVLHREPDTGDYISLSGLRSRRTGCVGAPPPAAPVSLRLSLSDPSQRPARPLVHLSLFVCVVLVMGQ
jgi:hypothetical protein